MSNVFNAYSRYYDLIYKDKDYQKESRYVHDLLVKHHVTGCNILELGAGTGRHAQELTILGHSVIGVDISQEMLSKAQSSCAGNPLTSFKAGDVRTIRLNQQFGAVISLFHVFSYQTTNDDIAAFLRTAASHLKSGGLLLFDFWYGPAVLTMKPEVRITRATDAGTSLTRIAEPKLHPNRNTVDVYFDVFVRETDSDLIHEIKECHSMRFFFLPELQLFLEAAGFSILNTQEWLTGQKPGVDTWGVVLVAKRN